MYDRLIRNTRLRMYASSASGEVTWVGPGQLSIDGIVLDYELRREAELILTLSQNGVIWGRGVYVPNYGEFRGRDRKSGGHFTLKVTDTCNYLSTFLRNGTLPALDTLSEMSYTPVSRKEVFVTVDPEEGPVDSAILLSVQALALEGWGITLVLDRGDSPKLPEGFNLSQGTVMQGHVASLIQTMRQFFDAGGERAIYTSHRTKCIDPGLLSAVSLSRIVSSEESLITRLWEPFNKRELRGSLISRKYWKLAGLDLVKFCASYLTVGNDYDWPSASVALAELSGGKISPTISISGLLEAGLTRYNGAVAETNEEAFESVPSVQMLLMKGVQKFRFSGG